MTQKRSDDPWVELGRVEGAWGLRGWLRIEPWTGETDAAAGYAKWWLGAQRKEVLVESARAHGAKLVAKLGGIDTRDAAQALNGETIAVPREMLPEPEPGRYYWTDLLGVEVVNRSGVCLGRVGRVFHNGAHEVIELEGERNRLLPWIDGVIEQVDPVARRIDVDWDADW